MYLITAYNWYQQGVTNHALTMACQLYGVEKEVIQTLFQCTSSLPTEEQGNYLLEWATKVYRGRILDDLHVKGYKNLPEDMNIDLSVAKQLPCLILN